MNYLQLVNKVLIRLRENEVSSVQETPYSKLIGEFINVVKREVEDAYNWSSLRTTITANTINGVHSYTLTGSTTRCRFIDVYNDTDDSEMSYQTTRWFDKQFQGSVPTSGSPYNYNPNGVTAEGDHVIDVYPIPDGNYSLRFNIVKPQADLEADSDIITVPYQLVIEGALARAISERGDDGGYMEQEARYTRILGDYISNEAGLRPEETTWYLA